ncbi:MAG: ribonuclease J [Alphaproteobacteria bacterium]|nr:ribonuclease J [Alphaproteobacteria bacterium]
MTNSVCNEDGLFFVPLGGSEQFGVNLNAYICDGDMIAVDCGVGFADEKFPGIDLLLPDPAFLEDNEDCLKAFIITHAHEDHVGAMAYIWERLQVPIYTTPFTAAVLHKKFEEQNLRNLKINVVHTGDDVKIGAFKVKFVPVAHSVPDACSLIIETPHGRVVHSGDWNLDPRPVVGVPSDEAAFKAAGDQGVLAYIGDSTNAEVDGRAGSESDVETGLLAEFKACEGKIIITSFSSNIGRVLSIARAAEKCGRKIGVIGRSLHRMIACAREVGLLDGVEFVPEGDLHTYPDNELVVLVTGSQGEYRAALAKLARGDFRGDFRIQRGDTVIFSARAIPGNETSINQVKNNLSAGGVRIVAPRDTDNLIHVSGHPCRDEIAQMFQWLRPEIVVPVHGERVQLDAHAAFARKCQVPQTLVPSNGSVIRLAPGKAEMIDHVAVNILAVDQKRIIKADHQSIVARRKLQFTGVVHASLALDGRGELLGQPKLETVGLIDEDHAGEEQIEDRLHDEILDVLEDMSWEDRMDDHLVGEELRIGIRRFCQHVLGIKPKTTVHVMRV